jgi:hypothetical protein
MMDSLKAVHKRYWAVQLAVVALKRYILRPYSDQNQAQRPLLAESRLSFLAAMASPRLLLSAGTSLHCPAEMMPPSLAERRHSD